MIFINPWAAYNSDDIPNLTPRDNEEMAGCLGAIISYCVSSLIFAIMMYFTHKLKSNDIINMDIMMLLFIVNVIIYVSLIFVFMSLSSKVIDKIYKKKRKQ